MIKLFSHFFILLTLISLVSAAQDEPLVESLYLIDSGEKYQVAFAFNYELIPKTAVFDVDLYINSVLREDGLCAQDFLNVNGLYGKVICPIEKFGEGNYKLEGQIRDEEGEVISKSTFVFSNYNKAVSYYEFEEIDGETLIKIKIEGEGENVEVLSEIPKEVIELLTLENKDSLIESDLEYEIIKEDPLIAWNVDKIPKDINYTIKKEISIEDRNNFGLEIRDAAGSNVLIYFVFFLLILVLYLSFKPALNKKNE